MKTKKYLMHTPKFVATSDLLPIYQRQLIFFDWIKKTILAFDIE
jgi:hypothetical protein